MNNNPFNSATFVRIWAAHFYEAKALTSFKFAKGIQFYKHPKLSLFVNAGRNLTKGMSYRLKEDENEDSDYASSTFLIYDVPAFFNIQTHYRPKNLGLHRVRQYPGYLIDLSEFKSVESYIQAQFSKNSRTKLRRYKKRLEQCFNITYEVLYGNLDKQKYDCIFEAFRTLLEKRFHRKRIRNNNLDPAEWEFYQEVAYPLILEKKANLLVIYVDDTPIAITLNYLTENILFDAITVFDIDYYKFHVGNVTLLKQIEWCLENSIQILDFSKGHFDYKERWGNLKYNFEYHIFYDNTALSSVLLAAMLRCILSLKQYMREQGINIWLHKLTFLLRRKSRSKEKSTSFSWLSETGNALGPALSPTEIDSPEYSMLKRAMFDFLYLNLEQRKNVSVYRDPHKRETFIIKGQKQQASVVLQ